MTENTLFLKLGGSLLTDKTAVEAPRPAVVARLAREIQAALAAQPGLRLLLGHGSGSFGHVAAARHGTREGVATSDQWRGFAEVSAAASRLNEIVLAELREAGVPALGLQPSASAVCVDGRITSYAIQPVKMALDAGLVPVVFGDVAFDLRRGGTIISTEEILMHIAGEIRPSWLLLAGEMPGVLDTDDAVVALITAETLPEIAPALGGSRGTDVTGGMASKVRSMLDLATAHPGLAIRIFSGLEPGLLEQVLIEPETVAGTILC